MWEKLVAMFREEEELWLMSPDLVCASCYGHLIQEFWLAVILALEIDRLFMVNSIF